MKANEILSLNPDEKAQEGRLGYFNMLVRRRVSRSVDSLGIILPGTAMSEWKEKGNVFVLAPGPHGGLTIKKPDTEIHAPAPGAVIVKPIEITTNAVLDGVTVSAVTGGAPLVTVRSGVRAVFRGCTFEKNADDTGASISVELGGFAVILGCVFTGGATTIPYAITHPTTLASHASRVQLALCCNKTPNALFQDATAQVTNLQITAPGAAGDFHQVTLNGVTRTYTTVALDTATDVAIGLLAVLSLGATFPPPGAMEQSITVQQVGSVVAFRAQSAGTPFTLAYAGTGAATATITTFVANVIPTATGTGNI